MEVIQKLVVVLFYILAFGVSIAVFLTKGSKNE